MKERWLEVVDGSDQSGPRGPMSGAGFDPGGSSSRFLGF